MAQYKKFTHVERLGKEETEGILNGTCFFSPKLDGTNALAWCQNGEVHAGSRTREITIEKDNAGFCRWLHSEDEEAVALREMLKTNVHLIVYGEFGVGRVANMKDYDEQAKDKLWIFDMFDTIQQEYVHPRIVRQVCEGCGLTNWHVPYVQYENPSMEDVINFAERNHFLRTHAETPGEGVVIRNPDFRNKWGNYVIAKVVRDEFLQSKSKPKDKLSSKRVGSEQEIINHYVTDAELAKAKAKITLALGLDEFDKKNGKCVGMYLNLVFNDAVLAEITDICKRWKRPVINFQELNNLCSIKAREYIGL